MSLKSVHWQKTPGAPCLKLLKQQRKLTIQHSRGTHKHTSHTHTHTSLTHTSYLHSHNRLVFFAFRIKLPTFFVVCRFGLIFSCASFPLLPALLPAPQCCVYWCMCVWNSFIIKVFLLFVFSLSLSLFYSLLLHVSFRNKISFQITWTFDILMKFA